MKYLVLIPDGSSDQPREDLDGRTPLQAAHTPNFDRLARAGLVGSARTIPPGFPPGSDVANLCVLGYDPHVYYTGRAPLEAASLGIEMHENDVAFRCNLVYVKDGSMQDFSAGHISTPEAGEIIAFLQERLRGPEASFYPGLSYRHIMISNGRGLDARCTPPHDITGSPVEDHLPEGDDAPWLRALMEESARLLPEHPVNVKRISEGKPPANMIWLWGQGKAPRLESFQERFGLSGAVISAVDLIKGLGKYTGLDVIDVPGATGWLDTDYSAKGRYALQALEDRDFVYVHVEAPDEASHAGDTEAKVTAIERFDSELLGTILSGLTDLPDYRMLILPDHATPLAIRTHTDEPVPFLCFDAAFSEPGSNELAFDEPSALSSRLKFDEGWQLMDWFIKKART